MRDTVSHLAVDTRDAAWGEGAQAANTSAAASADSDNPGSFFLDNLVREARAAALAAGVRARGTETAASNSSALPTDSEAPGSLAGPKSPFVAKARSASVARPLAVTGAWDMGADVTITEECDFPCFCSELAACLAIYIWGDPPASTGRVNVDYIGQGSWAHAVPAGGALQSWRPCSTRGQAMRRTRWALTSCSR